MQDREEGDPELIPDVNEPTPGDYASCGPAASAYSAVPCQAMAAVPCTQTAAAMSKPDDITYTTPVFVPSSTTQQGDESNIADRPNAQIPYAAVSYNVAKQALTQASAAKPAKAAKPLMSKPKPDAESTYDRLDHTGRKENDKLAHNSADIQEQLSTPAKADDIYGVPFAKSSSARAEKDQGDLYSRSTITRYRYIPPSALELGKIVASRYAKTALRNVQHTCGVLGLVLNLMLFLNLL